MDRLLSFGNLDNVDQRELRTQARQIVESMRGTIPLNRQALTDLLKQLPSLSEEQLTSLGHLDGQCPICFVPFLALLAEEEMAQAMDSPAHPPEELGVTRLTKSCGHIFCRKDISKWILSNHDTCPTCRTPLVPSDTRPIEAIPDSEISNTLLLIENYIAGNLEELRVIREHAMQEQRDRDVEGRSSVDQDAEQEQPSPHSGFSQSTSRSRSPTPPRLGDDYYGMYS